MKKFIKNLQFIFRPSFWLMNEQFCPIHDRKLNHLMDNHKFDKYYAFTAYLGDTEIWITNYPYAVGIRDYKQASRPSRLTILKMRKKLIKDLIYYD